ncbi:alpha-L-fucosidase [uncultured Bacteroides sp.]|uniref:alpha-L-fucosidase n=1 Tax=uncultured Bacteroides sp. TaxID=162156 RepID=UPI002AA6F460|nr:alpha-L-fucosidase [uncultured Bacteroides sp.]
MKKIGFFVIGLLTLVPLIKMQAQQGFVHERSTEYDWPKEKEVLAKLDKWQDMKFGILFHWGLYSIPGIVESWSICSEDFDWIPRDSTIAYDDYKKSYYKLIEKFNPTDFNPDQWADVAKAAGMKYMIFTTKHHDGFNLFNTKQTNFSVMNSAFKNNPKADVAKYVFEAFRQKDFMIGAYFSKPDWHCEYYWWPRYATPTRNVNYNISNHPDRWKSFQKFTYNQIEELMSSYGKFDILWLDGGWVAAPKQDIKMDSIAKMARSHQHDLLIVDRTIHGKYENYQTPERSIPETQLDYPWESCIPLSPDWGWTPNAKFKSANTVIADLIEVTAKGGSLLLGVGPTPKGLIQPEVEVILRQIGQWLKVNGKGIYGTRITKNYKSNNVWFTASKDGENLYALYIPNEKENLAESIEWENNIPMKNSSIILLQTGKKVKWIQEGNKIKVHLSNKSKMNKEPLVFSYKLQK